MKIPFIMISALLALFGLALFGSICAGCATKRPFAIKTHPDSQVIKELLSDDELVRTIANDKVKNAIRSDMQVQLEETLAHVSYKIGELFPAVNKESVRPHEGSIRDFVIRAAAQSGWWPQDKDHNTVRCTVYERYGFGPTRLECVVDVVCHDEYTISFDFVRHEYHTDLEWEHCSAFYSILTGRKKQSTRPRFRK